MNQTVNQIPSKLNDTPAVLIDTPPKLNENDFVACVLSEQSIASTLTKGCDSV